MRPSIQVFCLGAPGQVDQMGELCLLEGQASAFIPLRALDCPEKAREPGSHQRSLARSASSHLPDPSRCGRGGARKVSGGNTACRLFSAELRPPSQQGACLASRLLHFLPSLLSPSQPLLPSPTLSFLPSKNALCYEKRQTYLLSEMNNESRGRRPGVSSQHLGSSPDGHAQGSD